MCRDINIQLTDLMNTNIQPTDLMNTNIQPTDLMNTNIQPTDLMNTNIQPTDLMNTNIQPTDLICSFKEFISREDRPLTTSTVRYSAFTNDIGEALKAVLPRPLYIGSYGVTMLYATSAVYGDYLRKKKYLTESNIPQINKELMREIVDKSSWYLNASAALGPHASLGPPAKNVAYLLKKKQLTDLNLPQINRELIREVVDKTSWHLVASVALTPYVIHRIKHSVSHKLVRSIVQPPILPNPSVQSVSGTYLDRVKTMFKNKKTKLHNGLKYGFSSHGMRATTIPTIVGLLSIPLIVPPIDNGMTAFMNLFRATAEPYHWSGIYDILNDSPNH
jgi:hypothetical protein